MKNVAEDTFFKMKKFINCNGKLLDFSTPKVMGILNITPDSFYDGGKYKNEIEIVEHVKQMTSEGASMIDIGSQSTRPKADLINSEEEWNRLASPLKIIRKEFPSLIISVDTFYSEIAERAVDSGADLINDISGGMMDEKMFVTIAKLKVPYVLMHIQGTPQTMQENPRYRNVVKEELKYFAEKIETLVSLGMHDIIIDPGFGFGKALEHNYALLKNLDLFHILERPVLAGISRKSMVNKVLKIKAEDALNGTTVLHTIALIKGVNIIRTHDVKEAVETIKLVSCLSDF
jgi:dihydropteroate synthase